MDEQFTYSTETILGYKYTLESQAVSARQQAADYAGLPVPGGETLYWVNYQYALDDGFWFIEHVDGLEAVLGPASNFDVTIRNYITIINNN